MSAADSHRTHQGVPAWVLISAAALVLFTISSSFYARTTGVGRSSMEGATPFQTLQLRFEDKPDGSVAISDGSRGDVIYVIEPGVGGFVRATLRTMAQARKRDDIGTATPFRLIRWSDGTLSLDDPTTGRTVGLDAFGPDNAGAFAKLFSKREETK